MCTAVPLKQIRLKKSLRCQSLIRMHRFSWNTWIFMLKSSSPLIWFNWMPDTCISNDVKFRHSVKHDIRWFVSEWWKNQALNSFPNYPIRTNCNSEIFLRIVISKTDVDRCYPPNTWSFLQLTWTFRLLSNQNIPENQNRMTLKAIRNFRVTIRIIFQVLNGRIVDRCYPPNIWYILQSTWTFRLLSNQNVPKIKIEWFWKLSQIPNDNWVWFGT